MRNKVITVKNLSKTFYTRVVGISIFQRILNRAKSWIELKALKDVNFNIYEGEFVGIIGRNGSGKSTLLKMLIGAIKPNEGSVISINGKIMRLALGMGFDSNLSARDNIYLNGVILGMTFKQIGEKFDEIIQFAELQNFIDTPVKYFSTGMKSRLTFSIAQYADTDILLIDEFFGGVGDESFKKKSEDVFKNKMLSKKTILFVSHSLNSIKNYCDRVIYLKNGKIEMDGSPEKVIEFYKESFRKEFREKQIK